MSRRLVPRRGERAPRCLHPRLDRLDRHPGARRRRARRRPRARRALGASARGSRSSSRRDALGVDRIALADADAGARAAEAWTRRRGAARRRGPRAARRRVGRRPRAQRARRLGRPRADGRRRSARASTSRWPTRSRSSSAASSSRSSPRRPAPQIIPVDSEHSALHQLHRRRAAGHGRDARRSPPRAARSAGARARSSPTSPSSEALAHPTWAMGGKITIDSATLMNKGLEVIEAHHLFGTPYERIDVVVHPQSIVHALVHARRRRRARAPRPPRHARADLLRAAPPRARRRARAARSTSPRSGALTFEAPDDDDVRLPAPRPRGGGRRRHRAVRAQRRQRGRRPRVPRRPPAVPRHRRGHRARRSTRCPASRIHAFESLYEADRDAARGRAADLVARAHPARSALP